MHSSQRQGTTSAQALHDLETGRTANSESSEGRTFQQHDAPAEMGQAHSIEGEGDQSKSQIDSEKQAANLVVQFFDVRDGARSQPFLSTRTQLAEVLRNGEFNGISLDDCGVLVLMDKFSDSWTYSQAPIMSGQTFINVAEGK